MNLLERASAWLRAWKALPHRVRDVQSATEALDRRMEALRLQVGALAAARWPGEHRPGLERYEFQVFSQAGDDGIIQALVRSLPACEKRFVEFGVENYRESNTRFLLLHDSWRGLVMDGSAEHVAFIRNDPIYPRCKLTAVQAFVTAENVDELLAGNGFSGPLGLLSIDVDGNDFWIWKAIRGVQPAIVVVEYNARFGAERAVTIPYDPRFVRRAAHPSMIYYGSSLAALVGLGRSKGYDFVGCNSYGNNAYFVRRDLRPENIPAVSCADGFRPNQFRETRDAAGRLLFCSEEQEAEILSRMPLVDVSENFA